ncbi:MAG: anti-sigma F factor [Firmicutes bacterium]|nr:anti-sigma F factor [Bacillota bacterium]
MSVKNYFTLNFPANSSNESFARVVVASFAAQLDPTLEELTDVKTAVSEAVTNAIIHGYNEGQGEITLTGSLGNDGSLTVMVKDEGVGIADLEQAREPLFTTRPDLERSGMGFTIIENFMDRVEVDSAPGKGTAVTMTKKFSLKGSGGHEKT